MLRNLLRVTTVSGGVLLAVATAASEPLCHELDARPDGAAGAGFVLFSWRAPSNGEPPHALIASSAGDPDATTSTAAFGLWAEGGSRQVGKIGDERLRELRAAPAGTLLVRVDAEQLMQVVSALAELGTEQRFELPPDVVFENLVYRVVPLLGLKAPYRGGFGAGDPFALLRDLTRLNRPR